MRRFFLLLAAWCAAACATAPSKSVVTGDADAGAAVIIAETRKLQAIGIPIIKSEPRLGLAGAVATKEQMNRLAKESTNCGPYRLLTTSMAEAEGMIAQSFAALVQNRELNLLAASMANPVSCDAPDRRIVDALESLSAQDLWDDAHEFSAAYESRLHTLQNANVHVHDLERRLQALAAQANRSVRIDTPPAYGSKQLSIRARIVGSKQPEEFVVIGAHLDSVSDSASAPGANDNASGAAVVLAAFKVLLAQPPESPARTVDFIWYAAEEVAPGRATGLLGSERIAKEYKRNGKDVVGVLNLDMVMSSSAKAGAIAIEPGFTNFNLSRRLESLNCRYVSAEVVDYTCGYPCSDHVSWDSQNIPVAHLTEPAPYPRVHTAADKMDSGISANQGLLFAKLATAFVLDLANSTWRP